MAHKAIQTERDAIAFAEGYSAGVRFAGFGEPPMAPSVDAAYQDGYLAGFAATVGVQEVTE